MNSSVSSSEEKKLKRPSRSSKERQRSVGDKTMTSRVPINQRAQNTPTTISMQSLQHPSSLDGLKASQEKLKLSRMSVDDILQMAS
jgi:hypothetical protein